MSADNLREPDKLAAFLALDDAERRDRGEWGVRWSAFAWTAVPLLRAALEEAQSAAASHLEALSKLDELREAERTAAAAREAALWESIPPTASVLRLGIYLKPDISGRAREILALAEDGKKWQEERADEVAIDGGKWYCGHCGCRDDANLRDLRAKLAAAEEKARKWDKERR